MPAAGGPPPRENVGGIQRECPVVIGRVALGIKPAVGLKVLANFRLEIDFFMQAHGKSGFEFLYRLFEGGFEVNE